MLIHLEKNAGSGVGDNLTWWYPNEEKPSLGWQHANNILENCLPDWRKFNFQALLVPSILRYFEISCVIKIQTLHRTLIYKITKTQAPLKFLEPYQRANLPPSPYLWFCWLACNDRSIHWCSMPAQRTCFTDITLSYALLKINDCIQVRKTYIPDTCCEGW